MRVLRLHLRDFKGVTDSEVRDVALMVLAGRVNKLLVAAITAKVSSP